MSLKKNKGEGSMQIDLSLNIEEEKDTDDDSEETKEALEQETVEQESAKETPAEGVKACENLESANGLDKDAVKDVEQESTDTKEEKLHPFGSTVSDKVIYVLRPISYPKTSVYMFLLFPSPCSFHYIYGASKRI
jgi:hypothetical protein